jgi:hypothetical protein
LLSYEYTHPGSILPCNGQWHCGEQKPKMPWGSVVSEVQADGDEICYIQTVFHNIPWHTKRPVQRWHGDFAQFIMWNL